MAESAAVRIAEVKLNERCSDPLKIVFLQLMRRDAMAYFVRVHSARFPRHLQKRMRRQHAGGVMVPAAPGAAFVVVEAELALQ